MGRPFVGATGDEIERNLESNDLPERNEIYFTNLFRDYRGKDYKWTQEDLERDQEELLDELTAVNPDIVVTFGRWATRWFLGDVDMDGTQGIPWQSAPGVIRPEGVVVFPIIHPAAGMHNPEMSPYVVSGFHELKRFLDGKLEPRELYDDPHPDPHYEEITTPARLLEVTRDWPEGQGVLVGIDTEGWPSKPWSLQFSTQPGEAFLLRAGTDNIRRETLRSFFRLAHRRRIRPIFHSALHDLPMARLLDPDGEGLDGLEFDDTMVMAYLLQIVPQGLKASCLRECGMKMMEYKDVVGDKQNELARDYLTWLWDLEMVNHEAEQQKEFDKRLTEWWTDKRGKLHQGRRIRTLPKLPQSALLKAAARIMGSKRPAELWEDQVEDIKVAGYHHLGSLPVATLDYVSPAISIPYGSRDADGTVRLRDRYSRRIDEMGLREVYNLELATYPILERMQRIGLKPNLEHFAVLSQTLQVEIDKLADILRATTGNPEFNANSGDQVAAHLFGELGIEEIKMTRGGRGSTNDKILEALEHEHPEFPVITDIRRYREFYKLKNTFVDRMPDYVNRWPFDGRVHTTIRSTRVVTGRLAAADPNVLAQPEYGKWAEEFKRGWIAGEGHTLCAWDESQIELRGLAHLSQDPTLLAIYRGEMKNPDGSLIDLHAKTAQRIFGGDIEKYMHKGPGRLAAKAINFGIPMGMTEKGLSVELRKNGVDADEDTARRWLDDTLDLYVGVRAYMEARIKDAERHGYVRSLSGRIRYIGGIRSREERVRAEAQRFAFSTPIQESATFIMKQAEVRVWNEVLPYFWDRGVWVEPLIQIHDALKFEIDTGYEHELNVLVSDVMTHVPKGFSVPLAVEGEYGPTFANMKGF